MQWRGAVDARWTTLGTVRDRSPGRARWPATTPSTGCGQEIVDATWWRWPDSGHSAGLIDAPVASRWTPPTLRVPGRRPRRARAARVEAPRCPRASVPGV